jgi:CelD/BcsL family acetyltransferase involved in cellulose biosynthesis
MKHLAQRKTVGQATGISYQVLRSVGDIEAVSREWDLLLDQSPCNRAFSCSKWFLASVLIDPSFSPYVILARRGSQIAGILPLVIADDRHTLTFAGEMSDYNDMIARETDQDVLTGLLSQALFFAKCYDRVVLNRVRRDSNCARAVLGLSPPLDFTFSLKGSSRFIRLPPSYQDYLNTRSRNFRKKLTGARRGAENHNLSIRELEPSTFPPSRLAEAFLSLNLERWGPKCYYELAFPRTFVLKVLPELFAEQRLRAFALMRGDKLLGLDLCMVGANSLCSWNGGFLSEAGRWSPGTLLMDAGIKYSFSSKLDEYDLLRGDEPYKQRWVNSTREIGCFEFNANCS